MVEVVINPADPWAWAGLVGDAVDLLPFVTGVGEGVKAAKLVKYTDEMIDASHVTLKFAKATEYVDSFIDKGEALEGIQHVGKHSLTITDHLKGTKLHTLFMGNGARIAGTRLRVDGLDDVSKRVYELKPLNRRNFRKGVKQICNYNDLLGGGYEMILVFY